MQNRFSFLLRVVCAQFLFFPSCVLAQEVDSLHYMLDEAVLVSRHLPQSQVSAVPIRETDREDMQRLGMNSISEVLKQMPGVDVHDYGGVGGLKTVSVRGMGAKHTAVSYDGVVVSDAQSGMVDLGRFPLGNISAVGVAVGGVGSMLPRAARDYALSSMLSLKTLDNNERSYVKLQGGSFGYADVSAYGHYKGGRCLKGASLFAGYTRSDGMYPFLLVNGKETSWQKRRDSDMQSMMFEGNASVALHGGYLKTKVHYYDSERGLPGALHLYNKENRERLWNRNFFAQTVYDAAAGDFDIRAAVKYDYNYSRYIEWSSNYASGSQVDENYQNEAYASFAIADLRRWRGVELSLATDISYATLENNFANGREPQRLSSYTVFAGNYKWRSGVLSAFLLAAYIKDFMPAGAPDAFRRLSPAVSLSVGPFSGFPLRLRASFKDSFRVPTFADLYYLRLGNVALKPEKAMQYNVGATWSDSWTSAVKNASISLDIYYNNVNDKIVALPTMYIWRMMNFGKADIWGVDAYADIECLLSSRVSLVANAGYSFQYAVDVTDSAAKNYCHQLPYTPRHSGNFSLSLQNPWLNISYMLTAVGERYMLPQNTAVNRMPGYVEHSFSLNREFVFAHGVGLRLQGDLLNVTGEQYEIIRYYPMPGYSWRFSVSIHF